jgi:hypothetical protein
LARGLVDFTQRNLVPAHDAATWLARLLTQAIDELHAKWRPSQPPASAPDRVSTAGGPAGPTKDTSREKPWYYPDRNAVLAAGFHHESWVGNKRNLATAFGRHKKPNARTLDTKAKMKKSRIAVIYRGGNDFEIFFRTEPEFTQAKKWYDDSAVGQPA